MSNDIRPDDVWRAEIFPVQPIDGEELPAKLGLGGLLEHAHKIAAVTFGPPPAEAALLRRVAVLAARVTGLDEAPKDSDEWEDRRDKIIAAGRFDPGAIEKYHRTYADRFFLLDPVRPWLQDPRLAVQCGKRTGLNKLAVGRPAGGNHAWFGHHFDAAPAPLDMTEVVAGMLTLFDYGPSGLCTVREAGGIRASNTTAGPLRSAMSYFPFAANWFTTLLACLPCPDTSVRKAIDLCAWETKDLPDPTAAPPAPAGPCSTLTGRSQHALLLVSGDGHTIDDAYITWAWRHKAAAAPDPFVIRQVSQAGNIYQRHADSKRALWRDLDALLLKEPGGDSQVQRPSVFATATNVADGLRVRALGFEQDGQAKDRQYVAATTPPILDATEEKNPELAPRIGDLRVAGETAGKRLDRAVKHAWAYITNNKVDDCGWAQDAAARYWPAAESQFWNRLETEDFTEALRSFTRLAERTFDAVTDKAATSMRAHRDRERARRLLYHDPTPQRRRKRSEPT